MGECNLCGGSGAESVHRRAGVRGDANISRCTTCGHVFLADAAAGFDGELYAYYERFRTREDAYDPLNTRRVRELLATFAREVPGRRLLDVGCGVGQVVDTARHEGWDALGIDLAEPAIDACHRFGVPCRVLDFFATELDGQRFDVIHMSELIEHVPDPRRFVARAAELLVPGGVLYLTTPNFEALSRRVLGRTWPAFSREHVSYFTEPSLRSILAHRALSSRITSRNVAVATMASGIAERLRAGRPSRGAPHAEGSGGGASDQRLRGRIARSPGLERATTLVNQVVGAARMGETLVARAKRLDTV